MLKVPTVYLELRISVIKEYVSSLDIYFHTSLWSQCLWLNLIQDLQRGLSDVMNIICEDCSITSSHFEQNVLNYSVSGQFLFFATDLIFSNLKGSLTSITLINRFQSWILSENTPMLAIAGQALPLRKDCPTYANSVTRTTCLKLFNSSMLKATSAKNSPIIGIVFVTGLLAGSIAATVIVILVVVW